jgi:flavin reductase (DIM6/NTAB) family NADH-FMN oxidoreductase RutF
MNDDPEDSYFYQPRAGHGLRHDPFNAIVAPRPIGWISTSDGSGIANLAPYSFFNALNYVPPIVAFSSIGRKDSLRNVEQTGEFVWNLVTRPLGFAMSMTSALVPPEIDEFGLANLTVQASRLVRAPRVAESPVAFECRATQILRLSAADGRELETWIVCGEVVGVHIARSLLTEGLYRTEAAEPVLRGGGPDTYFVVTESVRITIPRPPRSLEAEQ